MTQRIWDITPPLGITAPVFPGDTPFGVTWAERMTAGASANVSTVSLSPHVGAHADAPMHLRDGAADAAALPLEPFLGPCIVIDLADVLQEGCEGLIGREVLPEDGLPPRVLLRTRRRRSIAWDPAFHALSPGLVEALLERNVLLVGVDVPSIDPAGSRMLPAHRLALGGGMAVLENLDLSGVPAGCFELIALPLPMEGVEASPVRAVLRSPD